MAVNLSALHTGCTTPQKYYFSASDTHFCWRLSKTQGLVQLEELGKLKKFGDLNATHDLSRDPYFFWT
jgi:hypothetical protein